MDLNKAHGLTISLVIFILLFIKIIGVVSRLRLKELIWLLQRNFKTKPEVQVTFEVKVDTTRVPHKFMWWVSFLIGNLWN